MKLISSRRAGAVLCLLFAISSAVFADTYTVTNTDDDGPGSLRNAISYAQTGDVVEFNIPGPGPYTIPVIDSPFFPRGITIDGTSQPGYAGKPLIELIPGSSFISFCFRPSSNFTVKGLSMHSFSTAAILSTQFNDNYKVLSCYFGLKPDGVTVGGFMSYGILSRSLGGVVGAPGQGNLFAGCQAVSVEDGGGITFQSNWVGVNANGQTTSPSGFYVPFSSAATVPSVIGGANAGEGNVFVDSTISIQKSSATIAGNTFGFLPSGQPADSKPGQQYSSNNPQIFLQNGSGNVVGLPGGGRNYFTGVQVGISAVDTSSTTIQNNWFELDKDGNMTSLYTDQPLTVNGGSLCQIGGSTAAERNIFGFTGTHIRLLNHTFGKIQGNWLGLQADGFTSTRNNGSGIEVTSSNNTQIGGSNAGEGNVINGGLYGFNVSGSSNVQVLGNYVGTTASGNQEAFCNLAGLVQSSPNLVLSGNVISACRHDGVEFRTSDNCLIRGNRIGLAASTGTNLGNGGRGIFIRSGVGCKITQNLIAFNSSYAIDLNADAHDTNDNGDADGGANNTQNYPVLSQVSSSGGSTRIQGSLNSAANASYTIEFYASSRNGLGGNPEGEVYIGSAPATTNASGNALIDSTFSYALPSGWVVTATATDGAGNTSEFSDRLVPNSPPVANAGPDQTVAVPHDGSPVTDTATFSLSGSASTDPDGDTLTYSWKLNSVVVGSTSNITFSGRSSLYTFILTVTDPSGASSSDTVTVTVTPEPNTNPRPNAGPDQTFTIPHDGDPSTNTYTFTLFGTWTDAENDPVDPYTWFEGTTTNNVVGTSPNLTLTRPAGNYTYQFRVTDVYGTLIRPDSVLVRINPEPNLIPNAPPGGLPTRTVPHDGNPATNTTLVTLTGPNVSDPDGDAMTYKWTDPAGNLLASGQTYTATLTPGTYNLRYVATDAYGAFAAPGIWTLTVLAEPNTAPSVTIPPVTVTVPHDGDPNTNTAAVNVPATVTDADNDPLTLTWKDANGNAVGSASTLAVNLAPGTYTYSLTAVDTYGATTTRSVTVKVNPEQNSAPVATPPRSFTGSIPHDGSAATNTANVAMTGPNSVDAEGDPITYKWYDSSGNFLANGQSYTATVTAGVHHFEYRAYDPYGVYGAGIMTATVTAEPNRAPVANASGPATVSTPAGSTTATFSLDGSLSSDPDGDTLSYAWSLAGQPVGSGATVSVTEPVGTYTFTLVVSDPYRVTASSSVTVTVKLSNQDPVAIAGTSQTLTVQHDGNPATNTVSAVLDGSASSDPDAGQTLTYEWRDGNGNVVGNSPAVSVTLTSGAYSYTLKVTDPFGASATALVSVNVLSEPNESPIVSSSAGQTVAAGSTGTATVSVSATGSDPDGDALTYQWYEGGALLGNGSSLSATLGAGTHTLTVVATDPYGLSASSVTVVNVWYAWSGFLQPINNDNTSIFKQGSTVPVKFDLVGFSAGAIPTARLYVAKVTDDIVGTEIEPVSTVSADTGNVFKYTNGHYQFNMSTKNLTAGTYRLRVDLGDGNPNLTVLISLKP